MYGFIRTTTDVADAVMERAVREGGEQLDGRDLTCQNEVQSLGQRLMSTAFHYARAVLEQRDKAVKDAIGHDQFARRWEAVTKQGYSHPFVPFGQALSDAVVGETVVGQRGLPTYTSDMLPDSDFLAWIRYSPSSTRATILRPTCPVADLKRAYTVGHSRERCCTGRASPP